MAKRQTYIVVDIGPVFIKVITFDVASARVTSSVLKDLSSLKTKEEKDSLAAQTIKEIVEKEIQSCESERARTPLFPLADKLVDRLPSKAKEWLISSINALRRSAQAYCPAQVVGMLSIADDSVQIRRIDLPQMPQNEIRDAVKWRIKGLIPFDIEKTVLDFEVIGESTDDDGAKKINLIVAAAPKSVIGERLAILKKAGLITIGGVNVDSFGLSYAVSEAPEAKQDKAVAVLKVDYKISTVIVYRHGKIVFVRNIPVGIDHIKASIRDSILTENGPVRITAEEAESLREAGVPDYNDLLMGGKVQGKHLLVYMRPVIASLSNEVARSIDYFNTQLEGGGVSKIYLIGDGSCYKNLDIFIKDTLRIDAEYLPSPSRLKEAPRFISLEGTARGGPGAKADLLPVEFKLRKTHEIQRVSIRLTGIAIFAVLILSFLMMSLRVGDYQKRLRNAKGHAKTLDEIRMLYNDISQREALRAAVRKDEIRIVQIMKEFSNLVPNNVIFRHLSVGEDMLIKVEGTVFVGAGVGEVILSDFMNVIEASAYLKDVSLVSSEKGDLDGKTVVFFTFTCAAQ